MTAATEENTPTIDVNQREYIQYAQDVEQALSSLESHLHNTDDPEEVIMNMLAAAAEFYDGDWAGIMEADLTMKIWSTLFWYNRNTEGMTPNRFSDIEDGEYLWRWIDALTHGTPMIIENIADIRRTSPVEYSFLKLNDVQSMIAVPFWKRPTGFLIVRNPKRYITRSSLLQMMAFVAVSSVNEKRLMDRSKMSLKSELIQNDNDVLIRLFGHLRIETAKGMVTEEDLNSPKITRLIAFLALHSKSPASVREIAGAVWPEGDAEIDGKNIKYLVYRLQRVFSVVSDHRLIESINNGYRLNSELNIITDLNVFEGYWKEAQQTSDLHTRGRLLKKSMDLYKDGVLPSLNGEPWIMPTIAHYNLRFMGVVNQLLSTLEMAKDYVCIYEYANIAVRSLPENADAQYWLIYAMTRLGQFDLAKNQLRAAKQLLTEEDYVDLQKKLKKKSI